MSGVTQAETLTLIHILYVCVAYECGLVAYYCPAGSSYPVRVTGGYYSVGGGNSQGNLTRTSQTSTTNYCRGVVLNCALVTSYSILMAMCSPLHPDLNNY